MKKIYLFLVIAVLMTFVACETQHYDSQSSSSGTTVIALVWKGESATAPSNPKTNWAYYNTTDKKSYIYDGTVWQILAQDGADGQDGKDGRDATADVWTIGNDSYWYLNGVKTEYKSKGEDGQNGKDATADVWTIGNDGFWYLNGAKTEYLSKGADGQDGISIVWQGNLVSAPDAPKTGWAYYNAAQKKSYIWNGSDWNILAQDGSAGGDGQNSNTTIEVCVNWKGSFDTAPNNPVAGWAYYNTAEKKSYIYDGTNWNILAQDGADGQDGQNGQDGQDGTDGANGTSIVWKGSFDSAPSSPVAGWAYYNTADKKSYIYYGSAWNTLAQDGADGQDGEDGEDGQDGSDGISILWQGSLAAAPNDPETNWAYYNTSDKKSYIFDGSSWQILAQDGQDVTADVHIPSYTIIFAANGGKGYMPKMVCEIGQTYDVTSCAFTAPEKMGFKCWDLFGNDESFINLGADGDVIVVTAQWERLNYIAANGNMVINQKEIADSSFVKVINREVTVTGSDDNWSSYLADGAADYYKGAFIAGRKVKVSPYSMGKYLVTQQLYEAVMQTGRTDTNEVGGKTYNKGYGDLYPAYYVSWYDAITFCNKLSLLMGKTPCYSVKDGEEEIDWENYAYSSIPTNSKANWNSAKVNMSANGYRLPTEAEWEFAARGGNPNVADWKYAFSGIDVASGNKIYDGSSYLSTDANLATVGWYSNNSESSTHPVGSLNANRLDLYDMSGNLLEWCWDWYNGTVTTNDTAYTEDGVVINPLGPGSGSGRCLRGGYWDYNACCCSVSFRNGTYNPYNRNSDIGFRLACSAE